MLTLVAALPLLAAPAPQGNPFQEPPEPLGWRFLEAWTADQEFDAGYDGAFGFGARGAWAFGHGEFVFASAEHLTGEADLDRFLVGGGYEIPLAANLRIYGLAAWVREDLEVSGAGSDDAGWRAQGGVRALWWEALETELTAGWHETVDQGFYAGLSLRWWVSERVALSLGYERIIDDDHFMAGVRYAL
jgi:hypothetical protein